MTAEDYDAVRSLWLSIPGFGIRRIDDSREEIARFLLRNPTTSVVAVEKEKPSEAAQNVAESGRDFDGEEGAEEKIVGAILCGSDGRQGYLYHVCVDKAHRRRGIGTQMVSFCMRALQAEGINKVALIAFTKNDIGNAFWKQIGWTGRTDCNYYEFVLNEENIVHFIEGSDA